MDNVSDLFLQFSVDKLRQLAGRVETCVGMLSAKQVWARGGENENAVGNLALHLCGNVRQWIIGAVGGARDVRQRDAEFAARGEVAPAELAARVAATVEEAVAVLDVLTPERLAQRVTVQNYDVTVLEAVYHVVEHFSQHTGQIVFATKQLTGADLGFYRHLNKPIHGESTP